MGASFKVPSVSRKSFALSQVGPTLSDVAGRSTGTVLKGTLKGTRNCAVCLAVNDAGESTSWGEKALK
jgi:hypothetical protein